MANYAVILTAVITEINDNVVKFLHFSWNSNSLWSKYWLRKYGNSTLPPCTVALAAPTNGQFNLNIAKLSEQQINVHSYG